MWQWLRSDGDGGGGAWQVHERESTILATRPVFV